MKIILAFLLSLVTAIFILMILYRPARNKMYKKESIHTWSEYNLAGLFIMLYPVLVLMLTVVIYLVIP